MNMAEDVPQKLSQADRLLLFGGNEEVLAYYTSLRQALDSARLNGRECYCDPRDEGMRHRLEQTGWKPRVSGGRDLGDTDEVIDLGGSEFGFSSKQTALEDGKDGTLEELFESEDGGRERRDGENRKESFVCGVQACNAEFTSLASYESHYHTSHNFVCHVCRRTFVSNFLLDVHLEENHDSYFQVLSPKIDMYRCLVECCSLKFRTAELRKDHLVKAYKFPASFSFHRPIKDKKSRPQKTKPSRKNLQRHHHNSKSMDMESGDVSSNTTVDSTFGAPSSPASYTPETSSLSNLDMEVDGQVMHGDAVDEFNGCRANVDNKSQLQRCAKGPPQQGRGKGGMAARIPSNICFGRGSQRAFQHRGRQRGRGNKGRHWHQTHGEEMDTTVDIERVDFSDMAESLVNTG